VRETETLVEEWRETETLVEEQPLVEVCERSRDPGRRTAFVCDHAGRVINKFSQCVSDDNLRTRAYLRPLPSEHGTYVRASSAKRVKVLYTFLSCSLFLKRPADKRVWRVPEKTAKAASGAV